MIRIENIRLLFTKNQDQLPCLVSGHLGISKTDLHDFQVQKKAVDARKKDRIAFVYSVEFETDLPLDKIKEKDLPKGWRLRCIEPFTFHISRIETKQLKSRPVIAGTGPCGLFAGLALAEAGLNPLLLERGNPVDQRMKDVNALMQSGKLNPDSNIQFGEGGAGTFSDGKLYTLINDPRTQYIFDQLILAGAPPEIAWDAKPHIGTDRLQRIVQSIRKRIIQHGGQVRFQSQLTDIICRNDSIKAVQINRSETLETDLLILAIGHSARDTIEMLFNRWIEMIPKAFSIGVRIEHLKEWIQKSQYGVHWEDSRLPSAKYKLAVHLPDGRGVYTFCMCPGGFVVPAATEADGIVTNGMSLYAQDGTNSNSGLLVSVTPEDFGTHPLAGHAFQRKWEQLAFKQGGGQYTAPVQLVKDFMINRVSKEFGSVHATYRPGVRFSNLRECLPGFISNNLASALPLLDRKLKGFAHPDAVLTGVETRSSSPVRILRDDTLQSNIRGLYPAGEGAGYAGGIISSAVDGIRVAEKILSQS